MALIRTAAEHDAASIAHVHVESWRTTYKGIVPDSFLAGLDEGARTIQWREWLSSGARIFVADRETRVVGFIGGGTIREPLQGYDAELFAIYLLEDAQRCGIGTALLTELARRLDHDGFRNMVAWVLESNASFRFYEKSGAHRVASKETEVGGVLLRIAAYGWPSLKAIISTT